MDREWCHDCAEGWDYHHSLGVALCPLHAAAPALLEALEHIASMCGDTKPGREARAAIAQAKGETA